MILNHYAYNIYNDRIYINIHIRIIFHELYTVKCTVMFTSESLETIRRNSDDLQRHNTTIQKQSQHKRRDSVSRLYQYLLVNVM